MNRKLYSRLLLAAQAAFLIQCSPGGFKASSDYTNTATNDSQSPVNQPPDTNHEARRDALFDAISGASMTGIASNSSGGLPNIDFDRKNGVYLIRIPLIVYLDASFDMTFKDYPGIRLFVEFVSSKPYMTLLIPVKYVLRNVTEVAAKLPNGDPVPLFPAGEPPSKGILLTPDRVNKVYLYLSAEAFGLFTETSFNPRDIGGLILTKFQWPIENKEKTKNLGYLTYVGAKNDYKGGFFVSHRIDPKLGKILDEYYIY